MMNELKKDLLYEMLEKIIFDEAQLNILKKGIEKVADGYLTPKELRKQIIELRIRLIEQLIEFFPFFLNQSLTENKLNEFTETGDLSILSKELEEKNSLFEEIGTKVNNIYRKLKETLAV
ncbi:MAG: hypothetical protein ACFFA4_02285 [Promethearchaeota archaeon]